MEKPLISILIPVYNCEPYLRECLDSVVGQTYERLEVICVNDGSTDGSLSILLEYAGRYDFIEVIDQENSGVASARNRLLEAATGDYILFVDADDNIKPEMAEWMLAQAEKENADVVTCKKCLGTEQNDPPTKIEILDQPTFIYKFIYHKELYGALWNKLIRRNRTYGVKFHPEVSYGEDALFCWHVFQNCEKLVMTNRQLYYYRMNFDSISHKKFGSIKKSSHIVWETIYKDSEKKWPQFSSLAKANYAKCDLWLLYFAACDKYPLDDFLRECQKHVRSDISLMKRLSLLPLNKLLFAHVVSRNYTLAKFAISVINFKSRLT